MALNAKILGFVAVLGGGGIGIPLYLKSQSKGQVLAEQKALPPASEATERVAQVTKPTENSSCQASIPPSKFSNFFQKHSKDSSSYSFVTCKNISVKKESDSLLKGDWEGLFPKGAFEEVFPTPQGEKFEMIIEEDKGDGGQGSSFVFIFKNPKTSSLIRSKYKDFDFNNGKKEVITVIEGGQHKTREIYLFVPE